jgi:hypothetical protein
MKAFLLFFIRFLEIFGTFDMLQRVFFWFRVICGVFENKLKGF